MSNNFYNGAWPIAGGGIVTITIISPEPLPSEYVELIEPVWEAIEEFRTALDDLVNDGSE